MRSSVRACTAKGYGPIYFASVFVKPSCASGSIPFIILILAAAVQPLAQVTIQRQKEVELRRSLREMRTAIDKFKDQADLGNIANTELRPGSENYPPSLEVLVEGVSVVNDASGRRLRFLRRVPVDPMTRGTEWGLRSYQDAEP